MSDEEKENKKFKRIQRFGFPLGIIVFVAGVIMALRILNDPTMPDELAAILGGLYVSVGIATVFLSIAAKSDHDIMLKLINIEKKLNGSNDETNTKSDLEEKPNKIKILENRDHITTWKYPKLANFITAGLIVIVFILVIWNFWSSYQESIKEYTFPTLEILKPITITAYESYGNGTRNLVYNQTKQTYINVSFTTTSLSALNPIAVKATMEIRDINDTQWEGINVDHIIAYPGAYVYNITGNLQENAVIVLEKVSNSHTYAGKQTIMFPFAGEYGFAIADLDDASDVEISKEGKYTIAKAVFTNLDEKILEKSKIIIEPSTSATTVKLAYLAQALAGIVIGIGILQLRKQLIRGILWIVR